MVTYQDKQTVKSTCTNTCSQYVTINIPSGKTSPARKVPSSIPSTLAQHPDIQEREQKEGAHCSQEAIPQGQDV